MASLASRGDDVNANGLIFLDSENLMVRQALEAHFGPDSRQEPVDIRAADFDDTNFHVFVSADKPEQAPKRCGSPARRDSQILAACDSQRQDWCRSSSIRSAGVPTEAAEAH